MNDESVSFEKDIKPLFSDTDKTHMSFLFDLGQYDDVKGNADGIFDAVSNRRMPPSPPEGEGSWSQDKIDMFKSWMDGGFQP